MGEYDRTGNGQSSKTDWDLRSILCDIAKNWWVILLIACSAAMITYTVMATVHKDRYTVKTTFAVMGRGVDANAASSLSATYEMAQKFEAILENTILKKKVMEELSLSSFPAKMNASIVPESNLMELSVTADSPEMAFRILKSVLNNYTSTAAATGFRCAIEPDSDQKVCRDRISCGSPCYGGTHRTLFLSAGYRQK